MERVVRHAEKRTCSIVNASVNSCECAYDIQLDFGTIGFHSRQFDVTFDWHADSILKAKKCFHPLSLAMQMTISSKLFMFAFNNQYILENTTENENVRKKEKKTTNRFYALSGSPSLWCLGLIRSRRRNSIEYAQSAECLCLTHEKHSGYCVAYRA